jgi:hypothetical protein
VRDVPKGDRLNETGRQTGPRSRQAGRRAAARKPLIVVWLAILAFVAQLGLAAVPRAASHHGEAEAAALAKLLGQPVTLCVHDDEPFAPNTPARDPGDCCDRCPICALGRLAAVVPVEEGVLVRAARDEPPQIAVPQRDGRPVRLAFAQPRAPPFSI